MKSIIALLVLVVSSYASAQGPCQDLTGVYKMNDIAAVRMIQNECNSIKASYGEIQQFGKIDWYKPTVATTLDGVQSCGSFGCVVGTVVDRKIELSRDNAWSVSTSQHGVCEYNQVRYSVDLQGNLVSEFNAVNCQDQYTGPVKTVFVRLN